MSQRYRVKVPFIPDMGTVDHIVALATLNETAKKNALWQINVMRDHDGLRPLKWLPAGTTLTPLEEQP